MQFIIPEILDILIGDGKGPLSRRSFSRVSHFLIALYVALCIAHWTGFDATIQTELVTNIIGEQAAIQILTRLIPIHAGGYLITMNLERMMGPFLRMYEQRGEKRGEQRGEERGEKRGEQRGIQLGEQRTEARYEAALQRLRDTGLDIPEDIDQLLDDEQTTKDKC